MRRPLAFVLAALLGLAALVSCAGRDIEAGLLMADLAAGPADSLLKRTTPTPERRPVAWRIGPRTHEGDLYDTPSPKAALVLVPGAARAGRDDPRLVAFATALARARWRVLVPDLPAARALEVSAADAVDVADAVRLLAPDWGRVGIAAVSYAAIPAVLAALEPDLAPSVDFVAAIGPPYDMTAVATFFTTGWFRDGPGLPWRHHEPNAYGKWVFVISNARRLDDSGDRVLLAAIAARRMADPASGIDDLTARLTPQGGAVMALLDNRDPERVPALLAALPPAIQAEMAGLDLSRRDLSKLAARLIVIHGRDDRIVPASEGAALARAAPHGELTLLDSLAHTDLKPGGLADAALLWRTTSRLLEHRDALAEVRRLPSGG